MKWLEMTSHWNEKWKFDAEWNKIQVSFRQLDWVANCWHCLYKSRHFLMNQMWWVAFDDIFAKNGDIRQTTRWSAIREICTWFSRLAMCIIILFLGLYKESWETGNISFTWHCNCYFFGSSSVSWCSSLCSRFSDRTPVGHKLATIFETLKGATAAARDT